MTVHTSEVCVPVVSLSLNPNNELTVDAAATKLSWLKYVHDIVGRSTELGLLDWVLWSAVYASHQSAVI